MTPTRIIQVSAYYPPHLGGQENAVHSLATQLAGAGHDVHVITSAQGSTKGKSYEQGVRVQRLGGMVFGHAPIMPRFAPALFSLIRPGSVVHLHIGQAFTPEMVWAVAKLRQFPYIAHLHIDFEPSGPAGILLPLYKQAILRKVLQGAAAVATLNQPTLRAVRSKYGYTGNAGILHNGLDDAFFTLSRPPHKATPPNILRLLFVGRLSKQKNIVALLQAISHVQRPVKLDIIGDGDQRQVIQHTVQTLGLANVTLHGRLPRHDIIRFYTSSHALIMPSLYEAQPLVLLESMAAGIPIIGTNVIGISDHLKGGGIIVEPSVAGLLNGIAQFDTRYDELPSLVARGREFAARLRWSRLLAQYESLYETVLKT